MEMALDVREERQVAKVRFVAVVVEPVVVFTAVSFRHPQEAADSSNFPGGNDHVVPSSPSMPCSSLKTGKTLKPAFDVVPINAPEFNLI